MKDNAKKDLDQNAELDLEQVGDKVVGGKVKVEINGFERIGRLAFRQKFDAEGYETVAINDLTSSKIMK